MRHLVREHLIDVLLCLRRGIFRIKKKCRLEIGNSAPVFHRAAKPAGKSNLIKLRQGIGRTEIIVVIFQNLRSSLERVAAHFRFAFRCDHTELRRSTSRFDEIEFACDENIEITRHRRSRGKAHFLSASHCFLALDRHVRYGEPVFRHNCRQLKTRAKNWLVPAGEKSASIGGFKLRSEHDLFCSAALLLVGHVEKSLALLIDLARKA